MYGPQSLPVVSLCCAVCQGTPQAANGRMQACKPRLARAYCAASKGKLISTRVLEKSTHPTIMSSGTMKVGAGPTLCRSAYSKVCCPRADKHNNARAGRSWDTLHSSKTWNGVQRGGTWCLQMVGGPCPCLSGRTQASYAVLPGQLFQRCNRMLDYN
jgi:hypothetical protein